MRATQADHLFLLTPSGITYSWSWLPNFLTLFPGVLSPFGGPFRDVVDRSHDPRLTFEDFFFSLCGAGKVVVLARGFAPS